MGAVTDFFVAGSWRNRYGILEVLDALDRAGRTSYCFVREIYPPEAAELAVAGGADDADIDSPAVRALFDHDLQALRDADQFILVLPAGTAAHIEAGIAYGLGKPCTAVGRVERHDTLHRIFERMFAHPRALDDWLASRPPSAPTPPGSGHTR